MSVEERNVNILKVTEADTWICTVNLVGAMGAGVAKAMRDNVPGLYRYYRSVFQEMGPNDFRLFEDHHPMVLLFPTKLHWAEESPLELVRDNLEQLAKVLRDDPSYGTTIAMPPPGCGNGRLVYEDNVRPIVHRLFADHPARIIVCR